MKQLMLAAAVGLLLSVTAGAAFAQRYDDGPGSRYYDDDRRGPPPPPPGYRPPPPPYDPPPRYGNDDRRPPPPPPYEEGRRRYDGPAYGRRYQDDAEQCAEENGFCRFRGIASVRYGARGRYVTRQARDGIPCTNEVFWGPCAGRTKSVLFGLTRRVAGCN